ncbi:hypothetical protein EDM57_19715 [Brevibacillus gelatini]|uniref:Replication-associated protein G2P N-terminal domain-containing protein n=1 Tax=Brevibacillus gelatini TaxID=1655277 RepID=A0A3M8AQQ0_9BACL|nr:phage/plasmid replication protein [Brevibacillus gelatini]RNB53524.1 hypothetical protein EDM57_19715 [Brevibacillus gelatini]
MKALIDSTKIDVGVVLKKQKIGRIPWTTIEKRPQKNITYYELFDKNDASIPRITYAVKTDTGKTWLKVEVSMARFLYGSNVHEVRPADIKPFFNKLRRFLADSLGLRLSEIPLIEQCEVEKLHLCKNFKVGVWLRDYLRVLSGISVPGYKLNPYHAAGCRRQEGVVWKRGKSVIKCYDKQEEIKQNKSYRNKEQLLKQADGVLRFEVELSPYEMRKQSPRRLAGELFDPSFITQVLQQKLSDLGVDKPLKTSALDSMINRINQQNWSTRTKNSLIAFLTLLRHEGEGYCKATYSRSAYHSNYNKLKSLFKTEKIVFSDIDLPPLKLGKLNRKKKGLSPSTIETDGTAKTKKQPNTSIPPDPETKQR